MRDALGRTRPCRGSYWGGPLDGVADSITNGLAWLTIAAVVGGVGYLLTTSPEFLAFVLLMGSVLTGYAVLGWAVRTMREAIRARFQARSAAKRTRRVLWRILAP